MRVIVIGASAAGLRAAARAKRLMPTADVTVYDAGEAISYAACGLPYYVSGDISEPEALQQTTYGLLRDPAYFRHEKDLDVRTGMRVERIDPGAHRLEVREVRTGRTTLDTYDRLVLATGAVPRLLPGLERSERIATFKDMADAKALRAKLQRGQVERAVIVGAGFIGGELAEALTAMWGVQVTLVEAQDRVLPELLDPEMARVVEAHLESQGVTVRTKAPVTAVRETPEGVRVELAGEAIPADHVVVAVGVRPNVDLAREAGVAIGPGGGIVVDEGLRTSVPDIFAAGDCIEVIHSVTGRPVVLPLGSLANRQGRVVGNNLAGRADRFGPVAGSAAVKVFELNVACTGLTAEAARRHGLKTASVWGTFPAIAHYYPESPVIQLKLVYEPGTGRLIGLQGVGKGEVVKRVDVFGNLLKRGGRLEDLLDAEFAYAPPYAPAVDPLYALGCMALAQENEGIRGVDPLTDLSACLVLDVRLASEIAAKPLAEGQVKAIPLDELRRRLDQVPLDRPIVVLCERGPRAAQAVRVLRQAGAQEVAYLAGGRQLRQQDLG